MEQCPLAGVRWVLCIVHEGRVGLLMTAGATNRSLLLNRGVLGLLIAENQIETQVLRELLRQEWYVAFLELLEQLLLVQGSALLHHAHIHVDDLLILIPELVEGIQIYVGVALRVDAVLELEWIYFVNLFQLVAYFCR